MKLSVALLAGVVALGVPGALEAQGRKNDDIPAASRPPAGMCRIWLDGVPAAQQPAPTDCASAVRNRPARGRVIFGDDYVAPRRPDSTKGGPPPIPVKGLAPAQPKKSPVQARRP